MLSPDERKRVQRATDGSETISQISAQGNETSGSNALQPMPLSSNPMAEVPSGGSSPSKELMFSGLPASVLEADKLFVSSQFGNKNFDKEQWHQKYEYVMVFPMMGPGQTAFKFNSNDSEPSDRARDLVHRMISVGLEVYPYLSLQGDELIVLITCSEAVLTLFTDSIDFLLELDPAYCKDKLAKGNKEQKIKPIKITDNPDYSPIHPFAYVYGKYDTSLDQKIYLVKDDNTSPFDRSVRLKIMHYMITMPRSTGGCGIKLTSLLLKREILAFYPPHNHEEAEKLLRDSAGLFTMPWHQPIEQIRSYMGEKVALYFVFIGHYSKWLMIPAVIGIAFELVGR